MTQRLEGLLYILLTSPEEGFSKTDKQSGRVQSSPVPPLVDGCTGRTCAGPVP